MQRIFLRLRSRTCLDTSQRGFTLVESLVYVAIVVVVVAASVSVLLSLGGIVQQYQAEQALLRSNTSVLERVVMDIRAAESVHTAASTFDDPAGVLVLTLPSGQVTYQVIDGVVARQSASGTEELHGTGVSIEAFTVSMISSGRSDLVLLDIDSAVATNQGTSTRSYTAGAVTRASYD